MVQEFYLDVFSSLRCFGWCYSFIELSLQMFDVCLTAKWLMLALLGCFHLSCNCSNAPIKSSQFGLFLDPLQFC